MEEGNAVYGVFVVFIKLAWGQTLTDLKTIFSNSRVWPTYCITAAVYTKSAIKRNFNAKMSENLLIKSESKVHNLKK